MTKKMNFKNETCQYKNLLAINGVLNRRKGAPVLYLIAKLTPKTKAYAKPGKLHTSLAELEELLIGTCLQRNPALLNVMATKFLTTTVVPGYLNSGTSGKQKAAKSLKAALKGTKLPKA